MKRIPQRRSRATAFGTAATAMLLVLLAGQSAAQDISVNYRDTDIRQVIEQVAEVTGRRIVPDTRIRGTVTLISDTPMTPAELFSAFEQMLVANSMVAREVDGLLVISPDQNAVRSFSTESTATPETWVTRVVRLDNVAAQQLVPVLRTLIAQNGHLAAMPGTANALIIVDRRGNVDRLVRVLRELDQAAQEDYDFIQLQNASAADIVRMMTPLIQQAAQASGGGPTVTMFADDRTNSVVLAGSPAGRLRFRALIAYFDQPVARGGDSRVYRLGYANAEELAEKLQAQFGSVSEEGEGPVMIWPDPPTNALVIRASLPVQEEIMNIIQQLDIRRAQVAVEAIIVEVSEQKAAELGLTWALLGSGTNTPVSLTNFGINPGGLLQLGAAAAGDTPSPGAIPQGVTAGVGRVRDGATSWAALLQALQGDSTTNIMFHQHLVTLDNEEAHIRVGQEVPFLTGQYTSGQQGGPGVVTPFQTIQREEVGTSLRITPRINEANGVNLTIEQDISSISQTATGAVDLITNSRGIATRVYVEDGDILVLGGLMDEQLLQGEQRVPGLGRIPGLGWLFRARNAERVKTNLMVFIRPTILRDSVQASYQTGTRYDYVRELQLEQQERGGGLLRGEGSPLLPEFVPVVPLPDAPVDATETD